MADSKEHSKNSFEDYTTCKVPESATVGGLSIGLINGSLAFSVPGLITGVEVGNALGFTLSFYAFLIGGLILSLMGALAGIVGEKNRYTSCVTLKYVFGEHGANFISLLFIFSLLGWYGVNLDLFSTSLQQLACQLFNYSPPLWSIELVIGLVITSSTILGFTLIEKASLFLVPIMILVLLYLLYQGMTYTLSGSTVATDFTGLRFGESVSIVVGSFIVSVVLMPDFSRFARSSKDAITASFLPFLGISSFVYSVSGFIGTAVASNDILAIMITLGLGSAAFFLLISASFITNVINLYSAALGANAIRTNLRKDKLIIVLGILGTVVASFNLLDNFTDFLFSLSIVFTPVVAIYVVDFLFYAT